MEDESFLSYGPWLRVGGGQHRERAGKNEYDLNEERERGGWNRRGMGGLHPSGLGRKYPNYRKFDDADDDTFDK